MNHTIIKLSNNDFYVLYETKKGEKNNDSKKK